MARAYAARYTSKRPIYRKGQQPRPRRRWVGTKAVAANVTVTPDTGHLILTGHAPTVTAPRLVTPAVSHLVLTGYAPTVATPVVVTPGTAHLVLTGYAPTVAIPRLVIPGTAHLLLTGHAPTVAAPRLVTPDTGHLVFTGYAPDVVVAPVAAIVVVPDTAHLILTGYPPTVVATVTEAGPDTRTLSGVPSLPKPRRRPEMALLRGIGLTTGFGVGVLSREAVFAADIRISSEGTGILVAEAIRYVVAPIQSGTECRPVMELALYAAPVPAFEVSARVRGEGLITGAGAVWPRAEADICQESMMGGIGPIRSGGEAAPVSEESEEALILAAAELIIRGLTA